MKLKFGDTTYYVDKKKGVCVCVLEGYFDPIVRDRIVSSAVLHKPSWFVAKGVAKLKDPDKWDETLGKRIAESKAKRNIYKQAYNYIQYLWKHHIEAENELINTQLKMSKFLTDEDEHFEKLTDVIIGE